MALEYDLILNGVEDLLPILNKKFPFEQDASKDQNSNMIFGLDLFKTHGFLFQVYKSDARYLQYKNLTGIFEEKEIAACTIASFRLDKQFDTVIAKKNIVDFCVEILKESSKDAFLIFNGDYLIFERVNGVLKINEKSNFWEHLNYKFDSEFKELNVLYI